MRWKIVVAVLALLASMGAKGGCESTTGPTLGPKPQAGAGRVHGYIIKWQFVVTTHHERRQITIGYGGSGAGSHHRSFLAVESSQVVITVEDVRPGETVFANAVQNGPGYLSLSIQQDDGKVVCQPHSTSSANDTLQCSWLNPSHSV